MLNVVYDPFLTGTTTKGVIKEFFSEIFRKEFPYHIFFYCVRTFAHIRQHCFSKYWGDGCIGRTPPQIVGRPYPSPPRSPPQHGNDAKHSYLWNSSSGPSR